MSSQPPPSHAVHGDYYAASQMGGNAGGHGNHNTIFNSGEEDIKTQLTKIKALYEAQNMTKNEYTTCLAQAEKIQEALQEMLVDVDDLVNKLETDRQKKFPPRTVSKMAEVDGNTVWPTPGATKSIKRGKQ